MSGTRSFGFPVAPPEWPADILPFRLSPEDPPPEDLPPGFLVAALVAITAGEEPHVPGRPDFAAMPPEPPAPTGEPPALPLPPIFIADQPLPERALVPAAAQPAPPPITRPEPPPVISPLVQPLVASPPAPLPIASLPEPPPVALPPVQPPAPPAATPIVEAKSFYEKLEELLPKIEQRWDKVTGTLHWATAEGTAEVLQGAPAVPPGAPPILPSGLPTPLIAPPPPQGDFALIAWSARPSLSGSEAIWE